MRGRGCITGFLVLLLCIIAAVLIFPPLRHSFRVIGLLRKDIPRHLPVPVAGIRPSQLRDTWGAARSGGRRHEGIDIFAKRNTPILSTTEGLVIRRGLDDLGGNVISVLGPGGQVHYYAHLENWSAYSPGDWVEPGDTLGYVGDSGNAAGTPPHLHYGIYRRAAAVNPYPFLR